MIRARYALTFLLILGAALPAAAQIESREGIALQNQLLQLRQEIEMLRRGGVGGGGGSVAPVPIPAPRSSGGAGSPEILAGLLDRVTTMEEEVRRLRGRADEGDFRDRTLAEQMTKLQGDMDFRLQALEGGNRPAAPPSATPGAPPAAAPGAPTPPRPSAPPPPAAVPSRPPERALQEGQAALGRRDFTAAETAAREVLANRPGARAQDAGILLGDALVGKREFQSAALAFDEAYRRNTQSGRAPEALLGLATSFVGFNARREACATLDQLRSEFPRLTGAQTERSQSLRTRAQCR
ncbi:tetratricopeptide repeat protein [Humitalea sp. 24SJ18S-53]|uniref:tetratricopeptide repeat protein n=1 Tax=Humitalea sp. 24SJ18S-53 TaxID=3422307 RepID=UPI003D67C46D